MEVDREDIVEQIAWMVLFRAGPKGRGHEVAIPLHNAPTRTDRAHDRRKCRRRCNAVRLVVVVVRLGSTYGQAPGGL